jgi:Fur family ferric uptake transcriptional regulator
MERLLEEHGIRPTANRLLIAQALEQAGRPLSLMELEARLETIDKSNISRALSLFREARLVHVLEDAGEGIRYELCHRHGDHVDDDLHVHFYCVRCHRTFCLSEVPVPPVSAPEDYQVQSASYLLRGVCPDCGRM